MTSGMEQTLSNQSDGCRRRGSKDEYPNPCFNPARQEQMYCYHDEQWHTQPNQRVRALEECVERGQNREAVAEHRFRKLL